MEHPITRRSFVKLLALLPTLNAASATGQRPRADGVPADTKAPNYLIVVFDAFSALDASLYGYPRETTPNLRRIAERATVYHAHYAAANYTTPGTASLLTGTYPWSHRSLHFLEGLTESFRDKTLFHDLSAAGYNTIGFSHNFLVNTLLDQAGDDLRLYKDTRDLCLADGVISDYVFRQDHSIAFDSEFLAFHRRQQQSSSLFLSMLYETGQRWLRRTAAERYRRLFPKGFPSTHGRYFVLEDAIDWMLAEMIHLAQPYCAYIHLFPPHEPYLTRREFEGLFATGWKPSTKEPHFFSQGKSAAELASTRQRYDEFIAYVDAEFARLYDSMASAGALDNTYLILTSDHGEIFERGVYGHITELLYEPVIRVPLVICRPGQTSREDIYTATSAVDVVPTLLHITGQAIPDWCEGRVLPGFGVETQPDRPIFVVEAKGSPRHGPLRKASLALIKGDQKLIHYIGYKGHEQVSELYNLAEDPEELRDLSRFGGPAATALRDELREKLDEMDRLHGKS